MVPGMGNNKTEDLKCMYQVQVGFPGSVFQAEYGFQWPYLQVGYQWQQVHVAYGFHWHLVEVGFLSYQVCGLCSVESVHFQAPFYVFS